MNSPNDLNLPSPTHDVPLAPPTASLVSRRTLIKVGWVVPTVAALELSGVKLALAQSTSTDPRPDPQICNCSLAYWITASQWPDPYKKDTKVSNLFSVSLVSLGVPADYTFLQALQSPNPDAPKKFLREFIRLLLCIKRAGAIGYKLDASYSIYGQTYGIKCEGTATASDFVTAGYQFLDAVMKIPGTGYYVSLLRSLILKGVADLLEKQNVSYVCS